MARLLLIRHASAREDARGRCYGTLDVELSDEGRADARRLAESLRHVPLGAVYTSPRRRALETAAPIAEVHGLEPIADSRLAELDFGELEGRAYDEIARTRPELYRAWMETPTSVHFPGGESFADLRERVLAAAEEIRGSGRTAALVTHGGVVRAILAASLRMPDDAIFRLQQDYCAVSVVEWFDGVPLVRLANGDAAAIR